jgi:hypothetical protein
MVFVESYIMVLCGKARVNFKNALTYPFFGLSFGVERTGLAMRVISRCGRYRDLGAIRAPMDFYLQSLSQGLDGFYCYTQ